MYTGSKKNYLNHVLMIITFAGPYESRVQLNIKKVSRGEKLRGEELLSHFNVLVACIFEHHKNKGVV